MTIYILSAQDIRNATGWGYHRIRTCISKPFPLFYSHEKPATGGRPRRVFQYADILARCRSKNNFTQEMAEKLAQIVQQKIDDK